MNKEIVMIICMTSGGLLITLGGYHWKWMRRYVLSAILIYKTGGNYVCQDM